MNDDYAMIIIIIKDETFKASGRTRSTCDKLYQSIDTGNVVTTRPTSQTRRERVRCSLFAIVVVGSSREGKGTNSLFDWLCAPGLHDSGFKAEKLGR